MDANQAKHTNLYGDLAARVNAVKPDLTNYQLRNQTDRERVGGNRHD